MNIRARVLSSFSCAQLCDPMDYSPSSSSVHGILQARIVEWVAMPSCRASSPPRDQTHISCLSCLAGRLFLLLSHQESCIHTHTHTHTHTHHTMHTPRTIIPDKEETLPFETTWMDIQGNRLSKINWMDKDIYSGWKELKVHTFRHKISQSCWEKIFTSDETKKGFISKYIRAPHTTPQQQQQKIQGNRKKGRRRHGQMVKGATWICSDIAND